MTHETWKFDLEIRNGIYRLFPKVFFGIVDIAKGETCQR
jgi:hypothetical protein